MDELIISPEQRNAPVTSDEPNSEPLYITYNDEPQTRRKSDDTLLTQCILTIVLIAVVLILKFTKPEFAEMLFAEYKERTSAPPEELVKTVIETVSGWFGG